MSPIRKLFSGQAIHTDLGLLVVRVVIGMSVLLFHGYGKITRGPETWERLGGNMSRFGIDFLPEFWGFMAAFAEFGCSALLVLGVIFRPAVTLLAITMIVAATRHLSLPAGEPGSGLKGASGALEFLSVYVALFLTGPGRYTILFWRKR